MMTNQHETTIQATTPETAGGKRSYVKPAFSSESVFETMALACGKVRGTQGQCQQIASNS